MLRFVNVCLLLGLVALAYVIYEAKYESRYLEEEIVALKKDIEAERDSIAVLRAEWSLLNRPERVERLALKYLNLARARPNQLVALDSLKDSDFTRQQIEASNNAEPAPAGAATKVGAVAKAADGGEAQKPRKTPVLAGAVVIPRVLSAR
jgi:cell division protein FtsL